MILELPLTNDFSQQFVTAINGQKYQFNVDLNTRSGLWTLSISTEFGEPLIQGIPLVLGGDLLSNNRFMNGLLYLVDYTGKAQDPTADNLTSFGLVWSNE